MSFVASQQMLARVLREYGMVIVLALLCLYYSLVTSTEQPATGAASAQRLADRIARNGRDTSALIVTRDTEEEIQFANALEAALKKHKVIIAGKTSGEPRAARQALEQV